MKKLGTIVGPVVVIGTMSAPSFADNVLLFGDHAGRDRIGNILAQDGHSVTVQSELPSLEGYDEVWHVGATKPLTANDVAQLAGFVNKGGGLYLTGDAYDAAAPLDASIESVINATVWKTGIRLRSTPITGSNAFFEDARAELSKAPNALYFWDPSVSGSIEGAFGANVLTTAPDGTVTSAAWAGPDMANGRGKLVVMMDAGWASSPYSIKRIVQNVQQFLTTGVPAQCGNAVAEEGENCDDGNIYDDDACLNSCEVASCGDGIVEAGAERCDDGNNLVGDGCDAGCQFEDLLTEDDLTDSGPDPLETDGVMVPDDTDDAELSAGCSAGGKSGAGGFVLAALALVGLARRKRS